MYWRTISSIPEPLRGFGGTDNADMNICFGLEAQYGGVLLEYIAASSEIGG